MAANGGAPAAGGEAQQQQQGSFLAGLFRMALMWYAFKQFFGGKSSSPKDAGEVTYLQPSLMRGTPVDVHFFITDDGGFATSWREAAAKLDPTVSFENVPLAMGGSRIVEYVYRPSDHAQNNGSVSVHAVFTKHGHSFDPEDATFDKWSTWGFSKSLTTYMEQVGGKTGINLLEKDEETKERHQKPLPVLNYLKPNVTVQFVEDYNRINSAQIAPHMAMNILNRINETHFSPHVYWNEFWILRDYLIPLNETVVDQTIFFTVEPLSAWKAQMMSSMDNSFRLQEQWGMSSSGESDEVKRIFLEGNPYFLALTVVVSLLHSVLDVLAFKSDIGFWKDNKSMKGLSARSVMLNAFCQLVVSLYLLDNETSTVVLISSFVGTAIEFWKITKAMDVSVVARWPYLSVKDKASYVESDTDKHDREAMKYLSYLLYPLAGGYAVYSLIYETHKSWYSFCLSTLVGAIYLFGFLAMTPQLWVNYRLKSVAALPAKQFVYKLLNTIIDDLFAFVIKMPLLHRLSVFRDDIVYLVFLYQRFFLYPVDSTRVNEYGYCPQAAAEATGGTATDKETSNDRAVVNDLAEKKEAGAGNDKKAGQLPHEDKKDNSSPIKKKKRVAIVGAGAAGMACAWSLSLNPDEFEVTVFEALESAGGVASTSMTADGRDRINDQVQGGAPSYRNNLLFFKQAADAEPTDVRFKIAFGRGDTAWSNHGPPSALVERCSQDIERFGKLLERVHRHEWYYIFVPIHKLLERHGFSAEFSDHMVFPLVALFFGTGNQTPFVSAAVIARVFLDPELRLFEYDPGRLLATVPTMFAFPPLADIFAKITDTIKSKGRSNRVLTSAPVTKVERRRKGVILSSPALDNGSEEFDDVVLACGADQALKILGDDASWRERTFLPNVKYYNDLIVTHHDDEYMEAEYEFDRQDDGDMYMIRTDPNNPKLIEMSFNLTMYQPHLRDEKEKKRDIYQSIFLDDSNTSGWSNGKINKDRILYKRMTRQFAHKWQHFAYWVPFVRFLQGHRHTWYAGAYCLANTHEVAVMTGLAAADRLGAPYPFEEDKLAASQYQTLFKICHGLFAKRTEQKPQT